MSLLPLPLEIQGSECKYLTGGTPFPSLFSPPIPTLTLYIQLISSCLTRAPASPLSSVHFGSVSTDSQKTSVNPFGRYNTTEGNSVFAVELASGHSPGSILPSDAAPAVQSDEEAPGPQDELKNKEKGKKAEVISIHERWGSIPSFS